MRPLIILFFLIFTIGFGQTKKITQSEIQWKAYKSLKAEKFSHFGTLKLKSGAVVFNKDGNLSGGTFVLDMNNIDAEDLKDNPKQKTYLENHLKSDDFFDTEKYPTSTFKINQIQKLADGKYKITGKLTIKNTSKNITFNAAIAQNKGNHTITSDTFTFNRKDFGLNYNVFEDMLIGDEVFINIKLMVN